MGDFRFLLTYYANELWERRWMILGVAWLIGVLGAAIVALLPDQYQSRASLLVQTEALLVKVYGDNFVPTDPRRQAENVSKLLYSREIVEEVIRKTDQDLKIENDVQLERLVQSIQDRLEVEKQGLNTDLYTISYIDSNPVTAQRTVQEVINSFIEQNTILDRRDTDESRAFIERKIAESTRRLNQAREALDTFQEQNVDLLQNRDTLLSDLARAEIFLQEAGSQRAILEQRRDQIVQALSTTPQRVAIGGGGVRGPTDEQRRVSELEAQLGGLLSRGLTERHPDVVAIRRLLSSAREQAAANTPRATQTFQANPIHSQLQSQLNDVELQLAQLESRRKGERERIERIRPILEKQPAAMTELAQLEQEYERAGDQLQDQERALEVLVTSKDIGEDTQLIDIRVGEAPVVAAAPIGPNRLLLFLGVLIASFAAGIGVTLLRVQMADNFPTLVHLREAFDLPVLGGISLVEKSRSDRRSLANDLQWTGGVAALVLLIIGLIYLYHFALWRPDFSSIAFDSPAIVDDRA